MNFAFKHMERSEAVEGQTRDAVEAAFEKFAQMPTSVNITFSVNKKFQSIHFSAHLPDGHQIELEENGEDIYGAIDGLSNKLQRKLSQIKGQHATNRKSTEKYDLAETVNKAED